ncbi:hypothetical protein L4C38_08375 [Vibrio kasasachensis]|uniref:hypothetical protein n=1 Tax=Vibrio kasasachensis TaxID=2910248 RepID=UPI003D12057B
MNSIKVFIIPFFLLFFPPKINANSCEIKGYTIGFFNGVATTIDDARNGRYKLKSTINIDSYNGEHVEYQLFYNDSYIDEGMINVLGDFAETFDQRTKEMQSEQFNRWEGFWYIISGQKNHSIIKKIESIYAGFFVFLHEEFSQYMNFTISSFLELLATLSGSTPNTAEVRMKHNLINDTKTWKGKKLIYIAHSQGNLWMNESFDYVLSQRGYDTSNIEVIHIAPASYITNGDYILSNNDHVINGLRLTGIVSVPFSNFVAAITEKDMTGHGLIEIYLSSSKSISMLKTSVGKSFSNLQKPDMEDFLFQIEYEYSPNFRSQHDTPQYSFVDSKEDLHLKYDRPDEYAQYRPNSLRRLSRYLVPKKNIQTLPFSLKDDEVNIDEVTINSCYSLHENEAKTSTIPSNTSFLFADYSNIKRLRSPLDMTVTKKVIDRYGETWVNHEYDASPEYDDGYASCLGFGTFIDLVADQKIYSKQEQDYLGNSELSGTFILSSFLDSKYCEGH